MLTRDEGASPACDKALKPAVQPLEERSQAVCSCCTLELGRVLCCAWHNNIQKWRLRS